MYKKLLIRLVCIGISLLTILFIVNIKVDGGLIFNNRSHEMAKIIVNGKNVGIRYIPSSMDCFQMAVLEEELLKKVPRKDIMVFGTSRSSEINASIFKQKTFFNCSMPGGSILEYIALYGLYKKHNMLPNYLIISIDPWTLHSRKCVLINNETKYIADTTKPLIFSGDLGDDYCNGLDYLGITNKDSYLKTNKESSFNKILALFSPNYFQLNYTSIFDKMVIETDKPIVKKYFIFRSDGGYSLIQQSDVDSLSVKDKTNEFINDQKGNFFIASDVKSIYWDYLTRLLLSLKKDGVIPIVYISPVNPIVFNRLADSSKVLLEEKLDEFCKTNSILRVGSFNPNKYGYHFSGNYFLDAYHPVNSVVESIFFYHKDEFKSLGIAIKSK